MINTVQVALRKEFSLVAIECFELAVQLENKQAVVDELLGCCFVLVDVLEDITVNVIFALKRSNALR